jgi:mannose-6-phosphate isomerase-like protein (cupin superfamily)
MARTGDVIDNPATGMSVRLVKTGADTEGELLEMEATYEPSSSEPPTHFHPKQEEHFEILEGTMRARMNGVERELRAGDTLDIEAGAPHSMWNPGPDRARTNWQTRPALRTAEFFEEAARVFREAQAEGSSPDGQRMAQIVETYSEEFRLRSPD